VVSGLGTHEKNGQHGCEQVSILVPECVYSEDEETWMNRIRNTFLRGDEMHQNMYGAGLIGWQAGMALIADGESWSWKLLVVDY
jgi:hypothetical protein